MAAGFLQKGSLTLTRTLRASWKPSSRLWRRIRGPGCTLIETKIPARQSCRAVRMGNHHPTCPFCHSSTAEGTDATYSGPFL
jgi:hypothetical protein